MKSRILRQSRFGILISGLTILEVMAAEIRILRDDRKKLLEKVGGRFLKE